MSRRRITVVIDVDTTLDTASVADVIRFHLGLGTLTSSDVDYSAVTLLAATTLADDTVELSWCGRCGHPYEHGLPTCECAGDPPVDKHSTEHSMWLGRVHRLEHREMVTR